MLDLDTRTAILRLHAAGHGKRTIAEALNISRNAVRRVLRSGQSAVPRLERPEQLGPHVDVIRELTARCKGNLIRVWEELQAQGVETSYSSLTDFCRRHEFRGAAKKEPVGNYFFEPGEEMQHDTSPHRIALRDRTVTVQCASLVLCYSRMIYSQVYPRWNRFTCRIFLDEGRRSWPLHARQLDRDHRLGVRSERAPGRGDARLRGPLRLRIRRPSGRRCQPLGAGRAALSPHREQLLRRPRLR
jgi:transposase